MNALKIIYCIEIQLQNDNTKQINLNEKLQYQGIKIYLYRFLIYLFMMI